MRPWRGMGVERELTRRMGVARRARGKDYFTQQYEVEGKHSAAATRILTCAMGRVPALGWKEALPAGAVDAGFLPFTAQQLLARGVFDLVDFHLDQQRGRLKEELSTSTSTSTRQALLVLCRHRLHGNLPVLHRMPEALAIMARPEHCAAALQQLVGLADDMWYLAGDRAVDMSWYSKRSSLAGVYAASELFMVQDASPDHADTDAFLLRRLDEVRSLGRGLAGLGQYLSFTGRATANILRSKGVPL